MPNFSLHEVFEATVNGTDTLTLASTSGKIVITNDDASSDLQYKFSAAGTFGTLKAKETIGIEFATSEILLSGTNVAYRAWVFS